MIDDLQPTNSFMRNVPVPWGGQPTQEQRDEFALKAKVNALALAKQAELANDKSFMDELRLIGTREGVSVDDLYVFIGACLSHPSNPTHVVRQADTPELVYQTHRFYWPKVETPAEVRKREAMERAKAREQRDSNKQDFVSRHNAWVNACRERNMRHGLAAAQRKLRMAEINTRFDAEFVRIKTERDAAIREVVETFQLATSDPVPEQPRKEA